MPFCMNCGQQLPDGARFCSACGTSAGETSNNSQRRQEWAGRIVKCPMCGEDLPSFTGICPSCSHEINSARISPTLQSFVHEIDECDIQIASEPPKPKTGWSSWSKAGKVIWVISGIFTCCVSWFIYPIVFWIFPLIKNNCSHSLSDIEKQKVLVIENYVVPNDRESILEMLLYIKSKVYFLNHGKADGKAAYWVKVWMSKAEHLNQKAVMMFPDDEVVRNTYIGIQNASRNLKRRTGVKALAGIILLLAYLSAVPLYSLYQNQNKTHSYNSNVKDYNTLLEWRTNDLFAYLPEPETRYGKIVSEYKEQIHIDLYQITSDQYEMYVEECRNSGYTKAVTKTDSVFYADNEDGLNISIFYDEKKQVMSIYLGLYSLSDLEN